MQATAWNRKTPSHVCREDVVMSVIRTPSRPDESAGFARVDLVDNWHKDWPAVLHFVDERGNRSSLQVDQDGWLSARQILRPELPPERVARKPRIVHVGPEHDLVVDDVDRAASDSHRRAHGQGPLGAAH